MATTILGRVKGLSAYEVWLAAGNSGTMEDYLAAIKGETGDPTSSTASDIPTTEAGVSIQQKLDGHTQQLIDNTSQLADTAKYAAIICSPAALPNYDTATHSLNFNSQDGYMAVVWYGNTYYIIPAGTTVHNNQSSSAVKLIFNTSSKSFAFIAFTTPLAVNEVVIALFRSLGTRTCSVSSITPITVDGMFFMDQNLPKYATADLSNTHSKVSDAQNANTISFIFITDLHANNAYYATDLRHFRAVSEFCKYGVVDFVCVGGDIIDGYEVNKATDKSRLTELCKVLNPVSCPVLVLRGNHDDNSYYTASPLIDNVISTTEWYNRVIRPFDNGEVHDTTDPLSAYYYKDFPKRKVRIVCLNAIDYPTMDLGGGVLKHNGQNFWGYGARQVTWLAEEALANIPSGYKVLVLSHMPTRSSLNAYGVVPKNGSLVEGVLKACHTGGAYTGITTGTDWDVSVNVDYTSQGVRNILAYVHGHNHADLVAKPEDLGWNYVSTANSYNLAVDTSNLPTGTTVPTPRTTDTDTEDCWDVITIDTATNVITCTRYGAGADRTAT